MVDRAKASGLPVHVPTLGRSLWRGAVGFTVVSLGGFAPWVVAGRGVYQAVGELGLYAACAVVFVSLSGLLLHRLVIGPGALPRFYAVFSGGFAAYAVGWTVGWMALRGPIGGLVGLLAGAVAMGIILTRAFSARGVLWKIVGVLFLGNALGYFGGGWAYEGLAGLDRLNVLGFALDRSAQAALAKVLWGLLYGLGFGVAIGFAFHACQAEARRRLAGELPPGWDRGKGNSARNQSPR